MARRPARLALVALEDRCTPTSFTWTGGGSTNNFSDAANWGGVAPGITGTAASSLMGLLPSLV